MIYGALAAYSYWNRPMFASSFGTAESDIIPRWFIRDYTAFYNIVYVDIRLNTVALLVTGEFLYRGHPTPRMEGGVALLRMRNGPTHRVARKTDTLYLLLPDGSQRECRLRPGEAASFADIEVAYVDASAFRKGQGRNGRRGCRCHHADTYIRSSICSARARYA
jgi:hypothetical protein